MPLVTCIFFIATLPYAFSVTYNASEEYLYNKTQNFVFERWSVDDIFKSNESTIHIKKQTADYNNT
jgi:hypothetical protein